MGALIPPAGLRRLMRMLFTSRETLIDDGTLLLPPITNGAFGFIMAGADEERCLFSVDSSGNVFPLLSSANVVVNADTDACLCIGTSVATTLTIKNRLGSSKSIMIIFWYT